MAQSFSCDNPIICKILKILSLKEYSIFYRSNKSPMVRKATQKHGKGHSKKQAKYKLNTIKGRRPLDMIQESIRKNIPLDELETLPANGKFGCFKCDVYFRDQRTLDDHMRTKGHKKRIKEFEISSHTSKDAEMAAGLF